MKKRADNRYCKKITINGKPKFVYGQTKQELADKIDELKLLYALGATNIDKKITVEEWAEKWWKAVKEGKTGIKSQGNYISALNNYIFPAIGTMKLTNVKAIHIQNLINDMGRKGKSKSLQHKVLLALNGIFVYAMRNGLIVSNPAQFVDLYEVPVKKRQALTPAQTKALLEVCQGLRAELAVHLALFCGLRRGEIVALKWQDINEEHRVLVIINAVEFVHNKPQEKSTKTKAGNRIIPIPPHLFEMLQTASKTKKSLYVVPSAKGLQLSETAAKRLLEPVQRRLDFPVSYHILRHTYATNLDKLGISPKSCQYLMGHSTITVTKNIYTHIQDEHLYVAAKQIENLYQASVANLSKVVKR